MNNKEKIIELKVAAEKLANTGMLSDMARQAVVAAVHALIAAEYAVEISEK